MNQQLAICILSANRVNYLHECLEAFLPQVAKHGIPIYISYNDTTGAYLEMLSKFKRERYPDLYFETDPNIVGFDRNLDKVVRMASTRYVWMFGDDDIPHADAIETILSHIDDGYALIIANGATYDLALATNIEDRRMKIFKNRVYPPGEHEKLLKDAGSYTAFLGGVIVDRNEWNSVPKEDGFLTSDYIHVAVIYRYIVGHKALALADPLVKIRLGGASWGNRYFQVELVHWPQIIWGLPERHYSDSTKRSVCQKKPTSSIQRLLATRAYGYYQEAQYSEYIQPDEGISFWRKALLRSILYLPQKWASAGLLCFRYFQSFWKKTNLELTRYRLATLRR